MMNKYRIVDLFLFLLYVGFLLSVVCAFRYESSVAIALILLTGCVYNKIQTGRFFFSGPPNLFTTACMLFFGLQIAALLYSHNQHEAWRHIQLKSALLFIPCCFYTSHFVNQERFNALMKWYVYILAGVITWCLAVATAKYFSHQANSNIFFYHQLVSTLGHHAIQFSILVFAGLIFVLQKAHAGDFIINRFAHYVFLIYFICAILLLSSKLVIFFLAAYLFIDLFSTLKQHVAYRFAMVIAFAGLVLTGFIVATPNPVSYRFRDILQGDVRVIEQPVFTPAMYFNGVQFRLLQWRFVAEIEQEQKSWLTGVSPADAQNLLNRKYIGTHMFTGDAGNTHRGQGYLNYNTHNQFLESLLQTGILGLLCFITICYALIKMIVQQKNRLFTAMVLLLIAYSFTESVFETQYGLVLFTFFPLFFYHGSKKTA